MYVACGKSVTIWCIVVLYLGTGELLVEAGVWNSTLCVISVMFAA